jgi:hypothetical protein
MQVPDEAVQVVAEQMFRRYESEYQADHLTWRDFAGDARADLEAAAPHLAAMQGVAVTEWGCRYDEEFVQRVHDEAMARKIARAGASLGHVPVSRSVMVGPWEELPASS